jgi:hypothetical protein
MRSRWRTPPDRDLAAAATPLHWLQVEGQSEAVAPPDRAPPVAEHRCVGLVDQFL